MGLAVGVNQAGRGAFDDELFLAEMNRARGAEETAREKPGEEWKSVERGDARHDREIEQPIVHARAGRNAGAVAVLVAVGDGEGEGANGGALSGVLDPAGFNGRIAEGGGTGAQIAQKTAVSELIETRGDVGLKTEARDGEKRMTVGEAGIDEAGVAGAEDVQNVRQRTVDTEVPAETVARAARHKAKGGGGADQWAGNLVECAVTAHGDDALDATAERILGELGGVVRTGGELNLGADRGGKGAHGGQDAGCAAGVGVDDEQGLHREIVLTAGCADAMDKK